MFEKIKKFFGIESKKKETKKNTKKTKKGGKK